MANRSVESELGSERRALSGLSAIAGEDRGVENPHRGTTARAKIEASRFAMRRSKARDRAQ